MGQHAGGVWAYLLHQLVAGTVRWDPPPRWEVDWVRRASAEELPERSLERPPRLLASVPRGREVCGGASVGVDVVARLAPCVDELLVALGCAEMAHTVARVLEAETTRLREASELLLSMRQPPVVREATAREQLAVLRTLGETLACTARQRFTMGGIAPHLVLLDVCPLLDGIDDVACDYVRYPESDHAVSLVQGVVSSLCTTLQSPIEVARVWLPAVLAVGGFCT